MASPQTPEPLTAWDMLYINNPATVRTCMHVRSQRQHKGGACQMTEGATMRSAPHASLACSSFMVREQGHNYSAVSKVGS